MIFVLHTVIIKKIIIFSILKLFLIKQLIMKKTFYFLSSLLVISVLFNSCKKDEFDETLLYGTWKTKSKVTTGDLYEKYSSNGKGLSWDTGDGMTEANGQPFTWTLVKSELRQIHTDPMGAIVPRTYTVTKLTANTFEYKDVNGTRSYSFTKQ